MYGDNPSLLMLYTHRINELVEENQQLKEENENLKKENKVLLGRVSVFQQLLY